MQDQWCWVRSIAIFACPTVTDIYLNSAGGEGTIPSLHMFSGANTHLLRGFPIGKRSVCNRLTGIISGQVWLPSSCFFKDVRSTNPHFRTLLCYNSGGYLFAILESGKAGIIRRRWIDIYCRLRWLAPHRIDRNFSTVSATCNHRYPPLLN